MSLPRVMVAAAASGQGKTTVAVGLMAALARAGHRVAPAKVGPDYIDPGYHALATGRPGRNLDPWLTPEELVVPLLRHGFATPEPADIAVIEGVMGLFDGRIGTDGFASTAHIATLTASPVVLVVDISSAARTVAATVHGLATFDPAISIGGVILNKSGSSRHADEVRRSVESLGIPVIGVLPRDAGVSAPSRHLGLVPVAERTDAVAALDRLAEQTAELVDLDALLAIAHTAPAIDADPWEPPVRAAAQGATPRPVVAVAGGRAFTFRYAETEEMIRSLGAEPVVFDPAVDTALPAGAAGLYLGGGFPEMHAAALTGNTRLMAEVHDAAMSGMPTVAECAGMLYLARSLDGRPFAGVLPATAAMAPRLTLSYRTARLTHESVLGAAGTTVHGHEFHRTATDPRHGVAASWDLADAGLEGFALDPAGTGKATVHASYLHTHWAGSPSLASSFVDSVMAYAASPPLIGGGRATARTSADGSGSRPAPAHADRGHRGSVHHHGDAEIGDGLLDFAVNVRDTSPPAWLARTIAEATGDLAAYPRPAAARTALARRHHVPEAMVLPTSGGAEAFTLIAQALRPTGPVVVHPQFTEPDAALARAGRAPRHVVLSAAGGFALDPSTVPEDADLVVVGNPTNPTGVLHPADTLRALRRPGRVLVVDEAFMDAVPGESQSLVQAEMAGLLVVRSLTKTWSVAGLRAGYVVGDPALIELLEAQQTPWSVSSPALGVMTATATPAALAEASRGAATLTTWRERLATGLAGLGLDPVAGQAPFVLVQVGPGVWEALRERGIAVRSCDSFPGLGPDWLRIAVRDPIMTDTLLRELASTLHEEAIA
ncbi:cobyrinate a,c-diamide synthase [Actinomycetota bacterium]